VRNHVLFLNLVLVIKGIKEVRVSLKQFLVRRPLVDNTRFLLRLQVSYDCGYIHLLKGLLEEVPIVLGVVSEAREVVDHAPQVLLFFQIGI